MARHLRLLLAICLLLVGLAGCADKGASPATTTGGANLLIAAVKTDPREGRSWLTLSEYEGDLDGDSTPEKLQLLVRADRSPDDGEIVWDDGQSWLLLVTDGTDYYPLLNEYVQLGIVYFAVYDDPEVATEIHMLVATGAGFEVRRATFSSVKKGYQVGKEYVGRADNLRHASFGPYR